MRKWKVNIEALAQHNQLGKEGEQLAQQYLEAKGFVMLHSNWRSGKYEIDLVAREGDMLVFVEVKSRSTNHFGWPDEFIGRPQQRRIIAAANVYMEQFAIELEARFDSVSIVKNDKGARVFHIRDAFYPQL